jgi:hypothetical protein
MQQTKQSWTRISIVSVIACMVGGISFGLINSLEQHPGAQLNVFIVSYLLVGSILSLVFHGRSRGVYISIFAVVSTVFLLFSITQGALRGSICSAFSGVTECLNNLSVPAEPNTH